MAEYKGVIHCCDHCGERTNSKYCKICISAAGRNEIDDQNIIIMKENISKGSVYNNPFWNRIKEKAGIV